MGGSSQSTSVKIPAYLEDAGKALMARANDVSRIGYTPYYGPDVAAMTAPQLASMQGTNQAAMAFGVPTADLTAGMPQAGNYGGMAAYSSGGMYDDALAALKAARPGQYNAIMSQFIDPFVGNGPALAYGPGTGVGPRPGMGPGGGPGGMPSNGSAGEGLGSYGSGANGGYSGFRDMFDGGGAGATGSDFSGGLLSDALNKMGVNPVGSGGGGGMGGGK